MQGFVISAGLLQLATLGLLAYVAWLVRSRSNRIEHLVRASISSAEHGSREILDGIGLIPLGFDFPVFLGRSSISAGHARELLWNLVEARPRMIVELGSGSSTILIAKALKAIGVAGIRHLAIDHDSRFLEITRANAALNGVDDRITFLWCPLGPIEGFAKPWYQGIPEALSAEPPIDLLIVDGPPAFTAEDAGSRDPSIPVLHRFLAANAVVMIDDANRRAESEAVRRWISEFPDLTVSMISDAKGVAVLRREGSSPPK